MFEFIVLALLAAGFYLLYNLMVRENGGLAFKLLFPKKRGKSSKKNIILWLLPWLILLTYIFMAYNHYIFFASVVSESMSPAIERGDVVLMQTIDKTLKAGDIVLFEGYGALIAHRVYSIEGNKIITKGDANTFPDAPKEAKKVLAKAVVIGGKPVVLKNLGYSTNPGDWKPPASISIVAFTSIEYREQLLFLLGISMVIYILVLLTADRKSRVFKRKRLGKDDN